MTYPFNVNGVGLDAIFEPYLSGTKAALTGYKVNGVDLKDVFAPRYLGTSAGPTGYKVNGADLNTIFAAKGSVHYSLPIDGQAFSAFSSGNITGGMLAKVSLIIGSNGNFSVDCLGNQQQTNTQAGTWLPAGDAASEYQVQFGVTQQSQGDTGPATIANTAPTFATCAATQSVDFSASVGQTTAQDKGGTYTVVISIKKISTGNISVTTIHVDVESVGTG